VVEKRTSGKACQRKEVNTISKKVRGMLKVCFSACRTLTQALLLISGVGLVFEWVKEQTENRKMRKSPDWWGGHANWNEPRRIRTDRNRESWG